MDLLTAIEKRRSVRTYKDKKIPAEIRAKLEAFIDECNQEGQLHMQLVTDDPQAFTGAMARYGKFKGVSNYIAIVCKKQGDYALRTGYYGEKVVLYAQQLGLNSCWVALTYSKRKTSFVVDQGEKLYMVISIGYGENQGAARKSKTFDQVVKGVNEQAAPSWFKAGVRAALLAPTATNQQKFNLALDGNKVSLEAGLGFYSKVDLGIVKLHFEIGAGRENFEWK